MGMLRIVGQFLTDDGARRITLRGENFNNEPALSCCGGPDINRVNVNAADYERLRSLGANVVRWGVDVAWWIHDPEQFFRVMDQHLDWCGSQGMWMVPVVYAVPGFSGDYAASTAWWGDPSQQQPLLGFWAALARRYAGDERIAGYDLLNEPGPDSYAQWHDLASRLASIVIEADPDRLIVFEAPQVNQPPWEYQVEEIVPGQTIYSSHMYGYIGDNAGGNYPGSDTTHWRYPFPLFIGEFGQRGGTDRIVNNIASFEGQPGGPVHWAHFVWREDCNDYGIYCPDYAPGQFSNERVDQVAVLRQAWTMNLFLTCNQCPPSSATSASPPPSPPAPGSSPVASGSSRSSLLTGLALGAAGAGLAWWMATHGGIETGRRR
jgi:hypothetical protein